VADLTFRFGETGADRVAAGMRKVADTEVLAARGARLAKDALEAQRRSADASARASLALAKADDILEEAEHGLADGALEAEYALKKQAEAEKKAAAAALLAAEAEKKAARERKELLGSLKAPGIGTIGTLLGPSLIPLAGVAAGAVAAVGASLAGAGIAAGAFGALAKTAFSQVTTAADAYQKAQARVAATPATAPGATQAQLAAARASLAAAQAAQQNARGHAAQAAAQARVTAAQARLNQLESQGSQVSKQRAAALKAEQQALAGLTGPQRQLVKSIIGIKTEWKDLSTSVATPVLANWVTAASEALTHLRPLVQPVADLFGSWGREISQYFASRAGSSELQRMATALGLFGADQMSAIGVFLSDSARAIANLGRDLAAHNVDFGAFATHLDQWGGAFLRWSQSAAARHDVTALLEWVRRNGPVTSGLLKNLGVFMAKFAPGLASAGVTELRLVSDFLGFIAKLPPALAKPLLDTAGALLLLQKTGVLKVGLKITGAAVKWLTGGLINLGGGAAAGAEIRAAMVSGGAAAAAEIRAAMAGGGAIAGAEGAGGAAAAGRAAGTGFAGGFAAALRSPAAIALAGAAIAGGIVLKVREDIKGGFTGIVHDIPKWFNFGTLGFIAQSASGWADLIVQHIKAPIYKGLGDVRHFIAGSWDQTRHETARIWDNITGFLSGSWHKMLGDSGHATSGVRSNFSGMSDTILGAMRRAGQATDAFRTKNLLPVLGTAGRVSGGIQGLQHYINLLHGKTVNVGAHLSGSGGVQVTPSTGAPGARNYAVYFKPLARGGRLPGYGGGDKIPALLEAGEAVVDKQRTRAYAPALKAMGVPGFASGGLVGNLAADTGADVAAEARASLAAIVKAIRARLAALNPFAGITGVPSGAKISGSVLAAQNFAKSILWAYGWKQNQFPPLQALWYGESGWRWNALNPSSGAYGIPQALPASKMAAAGADWRTNPATQIRWGLGYISAAYGSPANAYARWLARSPHWYGGGLDAVFRHPTVIGVGERGAERVRVQPVTPAGPGGGGWDGILRLEITGGDQELVALLRKIVRVKGGGDVQAAFGRR
jgi:hypothetical protein